MKLLNEAKWLTCKDPTPMLVFLRDKASERKLRLFAVACCRRIWSLIPDKPGHKAVEQAERYADRAASRQQLAKARWACSPRALLSRPLSERDNNWLAMLAVVACVSNDVLDVEAAAMASAMALTPIPHSSIPRLRRPPIRSDRNTGRTSTAIKPPYCARSSVTRSAR